MIEKYYPKYCLFCSIFIDITKIMCIFAQNIKQIEYGKEI